VALGERDRHTRQHSDRVVTIAVELGQRCGLSDEELSALRLAASFHDVGKIGIPDRILLKPGSLDAGEWATMKGHAGIGEKILRAVDMPGMQSVATAVRHHHEHFDGGGYPDQLAGEAIPILSRIISVADSYDAMAMARSYHPRRGHGQVMETLRRESAGKHDPYLVSRFEDFIAGSPLQAH
jgi:HD-GYP domain-containing protein (c-di-GMP phosphodiesterase class II)